DSFRAVLDASRVGCGGASGPAYLAVRRSQGPSHRWKRGAWGQFRDYADAYDLAGELVEQSRGYEEKAALVALSFSGAIGLTFLMLGCALEDYGVYWPLFVLIFHAISPIPYFIAKRATYDSDATSSACRELAYFFTTGIVVSAFGFPVILARVAVVSFVIKWGACGLVLAGNAVIFLTIQGFFLVFGRGDDFSWEQW
ncbi:hypothetical protein EI555_004179, partial [Monodon monoceros]